MWPDTGALLTGMCLRPGPAGLDIIYIMHNYLKEDGDR